MAMWDEANQLTGDCAQTAPSGALLGKTQYQPPTDRDRLLQKKAILESELGRVEADREPAPQERSSPPAIAPETPDEKTITPLM